METISVSDIQTHNITLTPAAAARVRSLLVERNLPDYGLRIFVSGGGCSGLQYGMALEGQPRQDDLRLGAGEVDVIIDPVSIGYLGGATIDYVDDLMGGGFKIENPNAVASCGCGHSFRTAGQADSQSSGGCDCG
ncbi:MAG: iron-sulfur cluster insertion protein ErpA [Anaerolineales bacterium]|nr:iron-sulfur cluster insertion protein ErpA [Anaerolineales bacterium]